MPEYPKLSDFELLELFRSGDELAFSRIFHKYWKPLVVHANLMTRDIEKAEDVVQDVFVKFCNNINTQVITTSLSSFFHASVRNRILNLIERDKVTITYLDSLPTFPEDEVYEIDDYFDAAQLAALIEKEIEQMQPRTREVFNLSRKEHLSHRQIAEILNISEHTVHNHIANALKILRKNPEIYPYMIFLAYTYFK